MNAIGALMIPFRLCVLAACLQYAMGARILAFLPLPAKSHHFAFWPILRELAVKGHHVDYFTPAPMPNPPKNLRHITIMDLQPAVHKKMNLGDMMNSITARQTGRISEQSLFVARTLFEEEPEMAKLVNSKEMYDMVITETHFAQEFAPAFCHKFKASCVSVVPLSDSSWVNEMSGLPDNPSYIIDFKAQTTDRMTFLERLKNVYVTASTTLYSYYYAICPMQEVADKHIQYRGWESRPSMVQLSRDMDLILINSHVSLGYAYPKAPHVKEVGGMNLVPTKPLPKDLQDFMDSATDGVIYFSYGSNVNVSEITKGGQFEAIMSVLSQLKQKVLWKWKGSEIPKVENASNVRIQDWFPQQEILDGTMNEDSDDMTGLTLQNIISQTQARIAQHKKFTYQIPDPSIKSSIAHKNTKVFITHGGLMSLIEAIYYGVPIIGTGIFGDQPKNLRFVENAGIGIELKYNNLTAKSLLWAVNEILGSPRYNENMKKRSELFNDRPMKPLDEAVYWIEYVLRHGKVLQPASVHMPFYQVYLLDVLGTVLASALFGLWLVKKVLRAVCSLCCGGKRMRSVPKSKKRQ